MATQTAAKKATAPTPEAPQAHDSLAAALAAFQAEMPTVHKGKTARIPGRDGGRGYTYDYADLADVAKVAHPLLAKHGLSFNTAPQHLEGVGFVLQGTLRHTSGQQDVGVLPITGRSAQDLGSSLTYLRRYLLGCMTGIVTDEDEDGTLADQAGTQRPEAEAPPAYQGQPRQDPQQQAGQENQAANALRPDQQILQDRLAQFGPEPTAEIREWWGQQGLPFLRDLDEYGVKAVMSYLDEREADPTANPQ